MFYNHGSKKDSLSTNVFRYTENNLDKSGKKQKEVYSSLSSLCHAWASENVTRGRSGASMFFENGIIYSYGYHYKAAKIYTNKKGEKLVLINQNRYSSSTGNHLSEISSAVKHLKQVDVPRVDVYDNEIHSENVEFLADRVTDEIEKLFKMRKYSDLENVNDYFNYLKNYCEFFGLKIPFTLNESTIELLKELEKTSHIKSKARDEKRKETEIRKEIELKEKYKDEISKMESEFPAVLEQWLADEIDDRELNRAAEKTVYTPGPFGHEKRHYLSIDLKDHEEKITAKFRERYNEAVKSFKAGEISSYSLRSRNSIGSLTVDFDPDFALLRVKNNKVETSQGADVPLEHAIRLLKMVLKNEAKKGERVGLFTLETIKDDPAGDKTICIGCHKILLSEAAETLKPFMNETKLKLVGEV